MTNTQFLSLLFLALAYGSLLPLLTHAKNVSTVSRAVAGATDSNDVDGLDALQRSFFVLSLSSGDPCFGLIGPWSWVECSTDTPARVTALKLKSQGLAGPLPDFSSMDALKTIDFSQNYLLTGSIPDFLGTLPRLKTLDLSYNDFSGTIPASILNNKNLDTYVAGNPKLSTTSKNSPSSNSSPSSNNSPSTSNTDSQLYYTTDSKKKSKTGTIVGVISSIVLIAAIVVGILAIMNHNNRRAAAVAAAAAAAAGNGGVADQKEGMAV